MTTINVNSGKLAVVFRANELPRIDPNDPQFVLDLGGLKIHGRVNAKAAASSRPTTVGRCSRAGWSPKTAN